MYRFKGIAIGVVLLCVSWTIPAHATIDWTDDFEYGNDAALGAVWAYSCLGNPGVSTARPFSGSKSLRLVYHGTVGSDPGAGGCYIDRPMNAVSDTMFFRIYTFMENFTPDSVGTKMIKFYNTGNYPNFWWEMFYGTPNANVAISSEVPTSFNVLGGAIPQNQWACLEGHIAMNTPGVSNGIIQTWVNGVLVTNRTNLMLRNAVLTSQNGPNSGLSSAQLYVQHGRGVIYYDNFAVSRDARIGCTGSPAGDTQAPGAPSNLRIN